MDVCLVVCQFTRQFSLVGFAAVHCANPWG